MTAVSAVALCIFALYMGLTSLGPWLDEFYRLNDLQRYGVMNAVDRIFQWSPRPISEFAIDLYCAAVLFFKKPLVASFVIPFWLVLAGALIIPSRHAMGSFVVASTLLAMFLLGHGVSEMYYWPAGVAAYVPSLAGAALLLSMSMTGSPKGKRRRFATLLALSVAATSSEVGALFSLLYILMTMFMDRGNEMLRTFHFLIPLTLSLAVLWLQLSGRVASTDSAYATNPIARNIWESAEESLRYLPYYLLKTDGLASVTMQVVVGSATKLLFVAGAYFLLSEQVDQSRSATRFMALAVAAGETACLTLFASFYGFGTPCCERHDAFRQAMVFIAGAALAAYAAQRWPLRKPALGSTVMIVGLGGLLWQAAPKLAHDYRNYRIYAQAQQATWLSGHANSRTMTIIQVLPGEIVGGPARIVGGGRFQPGTYGHSMTGDSLMDQVLDFYQKDSAVITTPVPDRSALR